ncbi:MAG: 2Fe-2S iron-sulfur cluster binding domain-containing protein, partial [Synergistaceae bacterium]|nr:2Fe-2S iron-sulfur cluster binding domain-containing protein [Synergistaceae bacterium]
MKIKNNNKVIECEYGESLYLVLAANNLIDAPCGGRGVCGKCGVEVDGVKKLSCEVRVIKDIEVTLPESEKAS